LRLSLRGGTTKHSYPNELFECDCFVVPPRNDK
jgi:hypothetical protein